MLHRILILTLIGTVAAEAFSMPQQQPPPTPSKTIYGVPNSGWTSPEWNWGYAAGTGHDCAAICRRKYASSEERSRLIGDLLLGPESNNNNSSNNKKPDLEEVKLVLALKWQRNYRSGYGDVLDTMADAVRYESERGNELLLRDMMERFHLLDPVEEDRLAMEGLAGIDTSAILPSPPQDVDLAGTMACVDSAFSLCGAAQHVVPAVAPSKEFPRLLRGAGIEAATGADETSSSILTQSVGAALLVGPAVVLASRNRRQRGDQAKRQAAAVKKKGYRTVEGKEIPWNLFSPKAPYKGSVVSNETITKRTRLPNWETTHTIMKHDGNVPYIEGQSIGIIAPGPDKKGETPAKIRLYSIASSSPGDDETSKTVSLCVKRVLEVDGMGWCKYSNVKPGTDAEYPDAQMVYRGVCSSHICDLKAGDDVLITGPVGAEMLLPEDPDASVIMMATGTGIAPFRSHLRHLFHDQASKGKYQGLAWLFLGVPFSESILYDEEWKAMQAEYPDRFRVDYAVSNEEKCEKNKINGEMWVQHKMMQYEDQLWEMVKDPKTHIYMCGLKGMETGFAECLQPKAEAEGLDWVEFVKSLKKAKRYHVEVY